MFSLVPNNGLFNRPHPTQSSRLLTLFCSTVFKLFISRSLTGRVGHRDLVDRNRPEQRGSVLVYLVIRLLVHDSVPRFFSVANVC